LLFVGRTYGIIVPARSSPGCRPCFGWACIFQPDPDAVGGVGGGLWTFAEMDVGTNENNAPSHRRKAFSKRAAHLKRGEGLVASSQ
jgi:inosine/xanthosine triphosphate pyrophosphatase family protein